MQHLAAMLAENVCEVTKGMEQGGAEQLHNTGYVLQSGSYFIFV